MILFRNSKAIQMLTKIPGFFPSTDASGMDFRAMLKKKKYAKNQLDDQGPDWGDLKPVETEPAPVLKKTDKVIHF